MMLHILAIVALATASVAFEPNEAFIIGNWQGEGIGQFPTYDNFSITFTMDIDFVDRGVNPFYRIEAGGFRDGINTEFFKGYLPIISFPELVESEFESGGGIADVGTGGFNAENTELIEVGQRFLHTDNSLGEIIASEWFFALEGDNLRFIFSMATARTPLAVHIDVLLQLVPQKKKFFPPPAINHGGALQPEEAFFLGSWSGAGIGIFPTYAPFDITFDLQIEFVVRPPLSFYSLNADGFRDGQPTEFIKGFLPVVDFPSLIEAELMIAGGISEIDTGALNSVNTELILRSEDIIITDNPLGQSTEAIWILTLLDNGQMRFRFLMSSINFDEVSTHLDLFLDRVD